MNVISPPIFEARTTTAGDCAAIALFGELDCAVESIVRDEIHRAAGAQELVIDLRGLTFMDVTGLRLLVELHNSCSATGRELRVVRGSVAVHRVLDACGVARLFEFVDAFDVAAA